VLSIGVDIGGTFTDILIHDAATDHVQAYKVPSTPANPAQAVLDGLARFCPDLTSASYLVHGTTVATNALLQRFWDRIGLITTRGHRDRVELQRTDAFRLYDLRYHKPQPLVERSLRLEVDERILADGTVLEPLNAAEVVTAGRHLIGQGVSTIAVCFLNSYVDAAHEQAAAHALRQAFPGVTVVASHEILSEIPEYERFSTTLLNCTVATVMSRYIGHLDRELREAGFRGSFLVTQGNGGSMTAELACRLPIGTFQSGPAAGVIAAEHVGKEKGLQNLITFDMGGTSTDVCIIRNGQPNIAHDYLIDGWPMRLPVVDIHSVGAGGGSLVWLDEGGGLHVGPRSAGARPGPASYGLGGEQATVTDAHVLLGRLSDRRPLGGSITLDRAAAEAAMSRLAGRLGMPSHALASGVLRIVDSHMANAIRAVSVDRGIDPRGFTLVAFGGAGPLHAGRLAKGLQIDQVLIPPSPGTHCALGCLVADLRHDFVRSLVTDLAALTPERWEAVFAELEATGTELLRTEGIALADITLNRLADMRYRGQGHVSVTLSLGPMGGLDGLPEAFHTAHQEQYKHSNPEGEVEVVSVRITAIGLRPKPVTQPAESVVGEAPSWNEPVYFEELGGFVDCPVYQRDGLPTGFVLRGPAIIHQMDSTAVVFPGQQAAVDEYRNLLLSEVP
jgi:N-methylhydantoinase A